MPDSPLLPPKTPKRIGVAADHGGFESKEYLGRMLREADYEVVDFGDSQPKQDDDYPDFVVPLARAVSHGEVDRGVAICGSGVGACIAANKVRGVRACLIHECFSAHQGVEDDDMNVICLGGHVVGNAVAWELVRTSCSRHDSAVPSVTGVVSLRSQVWKARGKVHAREPLEGVGNPWSIPVAGLYPARSDRQRKTSMFDRRGWFTGDDLEPVHF